MLFTSFPVYLLYSDVCNKPDAPVTTVQRVLLLIKLCQCCFYKCRR